MLKQIKNNWLSAILVAMLVGALVCVRAFEQQLFSDPLLYFFKGQTSQKSLPNIDNLSISITYLFRFAINSVISLAIIFVIFRNWNQVKFASILYVVFFIILMSVLLLFLSFDDSKFYMIIFYVRRFIIQPLLLILFLPAFYYTDSINKCENYES